LATRKEVSELAGVAEITVSRVLSGNGYVSQKKRELVEKAADQLGYYPSPIAVSFRKNATKQILLLLSEHDFENMYYNTVYRGAFRYAEKAGYLLVVSSETKFSRISKRMCDGIILLNSYFAPDEIKKYLRVPAVVLSAGDTNIYPWIESVAVDTALALELMIKSLNNLGHKRIALAMPSLKFMFGSFPGRYYRYISLLYDVFKDDIRNYIFGIDSLEADEKTTNYYYYGKIAAEQIYEKKPDITAVICFNDEVALGLLGRLHSLGIKVPDELSVAGIDDIFYSAYSVPSLSTVRLPTMDLGEESVRRLINKIEGNESNEETSFELHVIIRESVRDIN